MLNLWPEGEYDFVKILRIIKLLIEQIRRTVTAVHLLEKSLALYSTVVLDLHGRCFMMIACYSFNDLWTKKVFD